jgi:hypothetical protein
VRRSRRDEQQDAAQAQPLVLRPAVTRRPDEPAEGSPGAERGSAEAELERGRTVALISAIGRLQLSVDLIDARLRRIEESLQQVFVPAPEPSRDEPPS